MPLFVITLKDGETPIGYIKDPYPLSMPNPSIAESRESYPPVTESLGQAKTWSIHEQAENVARLVNKYGPANLTAVVQELKP